MHDHPHGTRTREEAAAYLKLTLQHNGHHLEELRAFAHDLGHLGLEAEEREVLACAGAYAHTDAALAGVLERLIKKEG